MSYKFITYFEAKADFLSHPFVIAIVIFLLGKWVINIIIPDKKQKVLEKIVEVKNMLKEVEFIYNRLMFTRNKIDTDEINGLPYDIEYFKKSLSGEFTRLSNLVNETIPMSIYKLDSEIEIYFNDQNLTEIYNRFHSEFKNIHDFLVNKLPSHPDTFQKKLSEMQDIDFNKLKSVEQEFITALRKAKSIKFKFK